jgi:ankyrin repeat protein
VEHVHLEGGEHVMPLAAADHIDVVKLLLNLGADPNIRGQVWEMADNATPLQLVIQNNTHDIALLLLKHSAFVNVKGTVPSPLTLAVDRDDRDMIKRLLDYRGILGTKPPPGQLNLFRPMMDEASAPLPLERACDRGNEAVVRSSFQCNLEEWPQNCGTASRTWSRSIQVHLGKRLQCCGSSSHER